VAESRAGGLIRSDAPFIASITRFNVHRAYAEMVALTAHFAEPGGSGVNSVIAKDSGSLIISKVEKEDEGCVSD
jgi:hypothetical protein